MNGFTNFSLFANLLSCFFFKTNQACSDSGFGIMYTFTKSCGVQFTLVKLLMAKLIHNEFDLEFLKRKDQIE